MKVPLGPFKKMLIYTLKPNKKRIIIPRTLEAFCLCIIFYLGIQLNLYLLQISISFYVDFLIVSILIILCGLDFFLNYSKTARLTYSFFDDKLSIENKGSESLFYQYVDNLTIKRNFVDKLFGTATIVLTPEFSIKFINDYSPLYDWIRQLVDRWKT